MPVGHADLVRLGGALGVDPGPAEQLAHVLRRDRQVDRSRPTASLRATLRATAPICRSSCRTPLSRVYWLTIAITASSVNAIVLVGQARLLELARDQVLLGDLGLLALGVAGELDDLHAVEQRAGDVLEEVGRGDEQHLAQVERHVQVVVGERVVLRRVEHLEQRARRVALERDAELVDLVEQEDRVLGRRPASSPG